MNDLGPERMHVLWRDVDQHPIICIPIKDDFPKLINLMVNNGLSLLKCLTYGTGITFNVKRMYADTDYLAVM